MALTDKLTAVADAIRAKTGKAEEMTLDQMPIEINNIRTNDGSTGASFLGMILETVALRGCEVTVTSEVYYTHFLYNGVRLPRIPENVLKQYPYAWIAKNNSTGYYDLVFSALQPYYTNGNIGFGNGTTADVSMYRIAINSADTATQWTHNQDLNTWFGLGSRVLIWSNHDIHNSSTTATDIYFEATEPVPTD